MEVRFWGTRGSLPTPGPRTVRFGGNTACVEVRTGAGHVFIFDCGTGARPLGDALTARAPIGASILFSHTHLDHIQRSEEHTSGLQSRPHLVCRLLLEKKKHWLRRVAH